MTDVVTEMPRSRSTFIQSERARRRSPRALTAPASWIAPPNRSSFSVSVVLPASGDEGRQDVHRRRTLPGLGRAGSSIVGELQAAVAAGAVDERGGGAAGGA